MGHVEASTVTVSLTLLQYLNMSLHDINKSPAQLATGRQLQDSVPAVSQNFRVDEHWGQTLREQERQVARHNSQVMAHTGGCSRSSVLVQNQANKTWNRSGIAVEARGNRQYLVKLDGSGRLSLCTRQHLQPLAQPDPSSIPRTREPSPPPSSPSPRRRAARPVLLDDYME